MTLKQKVVKSLKGICIGLALNQLAGGLIESSLTFYHPKIKIESNELIRYHSLPPTANALDYVDAANSLVRADAVENDDCKDYALATLNTYSQLVRENGRDDLEDKLRIVIGIPSVSGEDGHLWLEVEQNGQFRPYESDTFSGKKTIINGSIDKEGWIMARSFNGTRIFHPTFQSFFYPGGFARMVYLSQTVGKEKD